MLILGLLNHYKECLLKYRTRKALALVSQDRYDDMGLVEKTVEQEIQKASMKNLLVELIFLRGK